MKMNPGKEDSESMVFSGDARNGGELEDDLTKWMVYRWQREK